MLANCSEKTVYNILTLYHKYSQVNPRGCPRILDTEDHCPDQCQWVCVTMVTSFFVHTQSCTNRHCES